MNLYMYRYIFRCTLALGSVQGHSFLQRFQPRHDHIVPEWLLNSVLLISIWRACMQSFWLVVSRHLAAILVDCMLYSMDAWHHSIFSQKFHVRSDSTLKFDAVLWHHSNYPQAWLLDAGWRWTRTGSAVTAPISAALCIHCLIEGIPYMREFDACTV